MLFSIINYGDDIRFVPLRQILICFNIHFFYILALCSMKNQRLDFAIYADEDHNKIKYDGNTWTFFGTGGRAWKRKGKRAKPWTMHLEYSLAFKKSLGVHDAKIRIHYGNVNTKTKAECLAEGKLMIKQFMKDVKNVLTSNKLSEVDLPTYNGPYLHRFHFQRDSGSMIHRLTVAEKCTFCKKPQKADASDKIVQSLIHSKLRDTRYQQKLQNKHKMTTNSKNSDTHWTTSTYWMSSESREREEREEMRKQKRLEANRIRKRTWKPVRHGSGCIKHQMKLARVAEMTQQTTVDSDDDSVSDHSRVLSLSPPLPFSP